MSRSHSSSRHSSSTPDEEEDASESKPPRRRHSRPTVSKEEKEQMEAEEERKKAELEATKNALFGPRHASTPKSKGGSTASTSDSTSRQDTADGEEGADGELSVDDLLNFNLGDLDITTVDVPTDFDEVDDDLLKFQSDPLVNEALTKGVDLRLYSQTLDTDLNTQESALLLQYITHADELAELHSHIKSCDAILSSFEQMLTGFKSIISETAEQIAEMQEKSVLMSTKVDNRKIAQKKLHKFIDTVYIAPEITNKLNEGEVDEAYASAVQTLDVRLHYITTQSQALGASGAKVLDDLLPAIDRTKRIVLQKIKSHLTSKFHELSRPSILLYEQHAALLPYTPLYAFLIHQTEQVSSSSSSSSSSNNGEADNTAEEIRQIYVENISKYYEKKYRKFWTDHKRMIQDNPVERSDTLTNIQEERASKSLFGSSKGKAAAASTSSGSSSSGGSSSEASHYYTLSNEREVLLKEPRVRDDSVDLQLTQTRNMYGDKHGRVSFERIWKYGCELMVDSGIGEYDFVVAFFGERVQQSSSTTSSTPASPSSSASPSPRSGSLTSPSHSRGSASTLHVDTSRNTAADSSSSPHASPTGRGGGREELYERGRLAISKTSHDKLLYNAIFQRTAQLYQEMLDSYVTQCYDVLSLLILIKVIHAQLQYLHQLHIYFLDFFFDRLVMMLWPRFKHVWDYAVIEAIQKYPSVLPENLLSLSSSSTPSNKKAIATKNELDRAILTIHPVIQRYTELTASILKLNETAPDEVLLISLKRCRNEIDKLLLRTSVKLIHGKQQVIFNINNYFYIQQTLFRLITGKKNDESEFWANLAQGQMTLYIEEELYERFKALLSFVKQYSLIIEDSSAGGPVNQQQINQLIDSMDWINVEHIIKNFARNWREQIEQLANNLQQHFDAGTHQARIDEHSLQNEIVKQTFMSLLMYYQKFYEIMKKISRTRMQLMREVIPVSNVLFEIKKYAKIQ